MRGVAAADYVIAYRGCAVNAIKAAFRQAAARAGFTAGDVTPYVPRHTAATWMAQDGVPLWKIAGRLGHRDTRMVGRHAERLVRKRNAARSGTARLGRAVPPSGAEREASVAAKP